MKDRKRPASAYEVKTGGEYKMRDRIGAASASRGEDYKGQALAS